METAQEIFDQVATHLLTQKAKSVDSEGHCKYRSPTGLKCAIGCLITDEEYNPEMDGPRPGSDPNKKLYLTTVDKLIQYGLFPKRLAPYEELLLKLQHIHDGCDVEEWEYSLSQLANKNGLTFTTV